MGRFAVVLWIALLACAFGGTAQAASYYVSPAGDDANPGTQAQPWESLARVNNQQLKPGDAVLLQGGARFEGPLVPWGSGTKKAPVRFTSYGTGRATIASGSNNVVWFPGNNWIVLDNLRLTSEHGDNHVIVSKPDGKSAFITIRRCLIVDSGAFGINSPSLSDHDWLIESNTISNTKETGITFRGWRFRVVGNTIVDTGTDAGEAAHGVYAKGPAAEVADNTIERFHSSGISLRYQNSVARGNAISGGPIGIGQFQDAEVKAGGRTTIAYNTISEVTAAGIYLDGSSLEQFVIVNNTIKTTFGYGMNLKRVKALTVANNVVTGRFDRQVLVVRSPKDRYLEHHNAWFPGDGQTFGWNGVVKEFAEYKQVSKQGFGDLIVDPDLNEALAPRPSSPLVDAGVRVPGLPYRPMCDGLPFHFCGKAPDIGAVERPPSRRK